MRKTRPTSWQAAGERYYEDQKNRKSLAKPAHAGGGGVRLRRAFGYSQVPQFDPFLLLDDFRADDPADYLKGFPWHPHRGIETITYVLAGEVEHGDSMGNQGVITPGDVQWMTAGSGIIHQEMPQGRRSGRMYGFQLWANLPASHKMMEPRYRDVKRLQIPEVSLAQGVRVKIICGRVNGAAGPVRDIVTDPEYLEVSVPPGPSSVIPSRAATRPLPTSLRGKATSTRSGTPTPTKSSGPIISISTPLRLWRPGHCPLWGWQRGGGAAMASPVRFLLDLGPSHRGARCLVRPHCHEYPGRVAPRLRGISAGHLHQTRHPVSQA